MIISISLLAPSPRIQEGARGGVGGAREPRLHMCQLEGDCLPVFASSSSHTHLARLGMARLRRGFPHTHHHHRGRTSIRISFSLCFFFLHFFARMERMPVKGEGEYHIGHMSLFHIRIRCGISPTAPSHTTTFAAKPTLPRALGPGLFS